ncbi:prophage PSSB64-01 [Pseudomonas coronafaciens pv. porri]|uniref:Prophage PSSB64-01 n=1 Tax=Pseudomonas coronafaciens pv. porri TaxID=83964 RepID=A0ABR5JGH5_9PSED|nr:MULTISPECIES: hypothetical protein [Pseudomonas syringae group]KGS15976.1 prophage PSSB64-01 [Pseudomonas coronafaciens]KOP51738.1 prophage PSSB64-01 [Pseudomonas coronafaciens pv. porri]KPZ26910.1 Uncharacterized protein ALO38_04165 [Pseudomonas coronafaciens pv. zizaniae]MCF5747139.1 hypothetical protein [Pseudomonas tremae]QQN27118.1 hypothetical protein JHZ65_26655 [Pseudomonas syringae pv. maculicola]
MQTEHLSSSLSKASTPSRNLLIIAMIGTALIGYQVHKTQDARGRLVGLASLAQVQGDLTASDLDVLAQILATPTPSN